MLISIVITFVICWCPILIFNVLHAFGTVKKISYEHTVATDELLYLKNAGTQISMFFTSNEYSAPMAIEKIPIVLELPARQHGHSSLFITNMGQMG